MSPRAAQWCASATGSHAPDFALKVAKTVELVLALRPVGEVLVFGAHAGNAVRKALPVSAKQVGRDYGLDDARSHDVATYCFFCHPQLLLADWAGVKTSTRRARVFHDFAARYRAKHKDTGNTRACIMRFVERIAEGLTDAQCDFERARLLRFIEKVRC